MYRKSVSPQGKTLPFNAKTRSEQRTDQSPSSPFRGTNDEDGPNAIKNRVNGIDVKFFKV